MKKPILSSRLGLAELQGQPFESQFICWSWQTADHIEYLKRDSWLIKQAVVFCSILVPDRGLGCCLSFCIVKCQQEEGGCVPIQGTGPKATTHQRARKQLFQSSGMSHHQSTAGFAFCSPACCQCASLRAAGCSLGVVAVTDYRK